MPEEFPVGDIVQLKSGGPDMTVEDQTSHTRHLQLPFPTYDAKALTKLVQLDLEAHPPAAAIAALTIAVKPVDPRVVQNGLYTPPAPEPEKLELTLSKIRAMVGVRKAGSPELLNTFKPGSPCAPGSSQAQVSLRPRYFSGHVLGAEILLRVWELDAKWRRRDSHQPEHGLSKCNHPTGPLYPFAAAKCSGVAQVLSSSSEAPCECATRAIAGTS